MTTGSSPLARGLQTFRRSRSPIIGIIPARAGFTARQGVENIGLEDHPRSRGVYYQNLDSMPGGSGSSPLARGLRRALAAHATPGTDHPRSRGVYPPLREAHHQSAGSSPLARGLRSVARRNRIPWWIIPARAGFTFSSGAGPRYCAGSSPLARGLRAENHRLALHNRIIPARAGFTHPLNSNSSPTPDHPRSRGVYWTTDGGSKRRTGSSPLARGLRL